MTNLIDLIQFNGQFKWFDTHHGNTEFTTVRLSTFDRLFKLYERTHFEWFHN